MKRVKINNRRRLMKKQVEKDDDLALCSNCMLFFNQVNLIENYCHNDCGECEDYNRCEWCHRRECEYCWKTIDDKDNRLKISTIEGFGDEVICVECVKEYCYHFNFDESRSDNELSINEYVKEFYPKKRFRNDLSFKEFVRRDKNML